MKVNLRRIKGNWDDGYVLDKHKIRSIFIGHYPNGRPQFDTLRTDIGEAVYQLKYNGDWTKCAPLAKAVHDHIVPLFPKIGLVVPMPPSQPRSRQPVDGVAEELAKLMGLTVFGDLIAKSPSTTGKKLKDLTSKPEKVAELAGRLSINDTIGGDGKWNALLIDDLFDSGASMEAATAALKSYNKISGVYVAALTWK
ncbi:ComF family protein [Rhizobium alvei]|uniref:ComF family protein n=1 Tax=Rhizobium alvei TaxID=1132659 RepID=A0ABT8YTS7_9HYPH|nr:ComF family protein [Rhizobium alvei]MDO6967109.1 ComF family protein [Rhizobium alvei]